MKTAEKKIFNLILLGDPGAGKATQGERLVKKYPFLQEFDFGAWLRRLKSPAMRRKYKIEATIRKGKPAPSRLAKQMFRGVILSTPKNRGVFFNGSPKLKSEAKTVASAFHDAGRENVFVIYLTVPEKEMIKRLKIRQRVEGRSDDEMRHLQNRMRYYRESLLPGVAFLATQFAFRKINGVGTRDAVFKRLVTAIETHKNKTSLVIPAQAGIQGRRKRAGFPHSRG